VCESTPMVEGPITAAVVSAHEIVHTGLAGMFATRPGAVEIVELDLGAPDDDQPDVILYDVYGIHDGNGDDLDRYVKDTVSAVVAMARDLRPDLAARAVARGVDACVSMAGDVDDILAVIRSAVDGEGQPDASGPGAEQGGAYVVLGEEVGLTPRETEVLQLMTRGLSNQEIAETCFLSINSVKSYIRSAYRRIGATSRSQAVVWCLQHGFAPPDDTPGGEGHDGTDGGPAPAGS
jgi:DNA-binding NarL/FixJ family response regulator